MNAHDKYEDSFDEATQKVDFCGFKGALVEESMCFRGELRGVGEEKWQCYMR